MQNDFTYRVKLNFLHNSLALFTFNVQVYKVGFVSVDQIAE